MSIKIYGDPGSGSLRRVTSAAAIMGIPVERMHVDLLKGESHTPEFLKNLNPHGLTPVMVDGDVTLYESSAINLYLAEKVGSDLLGGCGRFIPMAAADKDIRPGRCKPGGHRLAKALGATGNDRRAACQIELLDAG